MGFKRWVCLALLLLSSVTHAEQYMTQEAFLSEVFGESVPKSDTLWLNDALKHTAKAVLSHDYAGLRVRYWREGNRTAWVLKEIGKERPITIGVVIKGDAIERVAILEFLESRGWEVKYPYFTEQFDGVALQESYQLNRSVDGITGATLSVRAVTKVARLCLVFHQHITQAL